jgi:hypothetical protein
MYVKLDLFSGRPNPAWRLDDATARELTDQMAGRSMAAPTARLPDGLGFRGLVVQRELGDPPVPPDLPLRFRIAPTPHGDKMAMVEAPDLVRSLLEKAWPEMDPEIARLAMTSAEDLMSRSAQAAQKSAATRRARRAAAPDTQESASAPQTGVLRKAMTMAATATTVPPVLTGFNPAFWNGSVVMLNNNCYNFATNLATNTVAQPGRRVGQMYNAFSTAAVLDAAFADGYRADNHRPSRIVALAIWPGFDFHWWRLHPNNMWAHKLGLSTARNFDNLGNILAGGLTPENCERHPYTEFAGFFFAPLGTRVI